MVAPVALENDPSNPCIGCGPANPHGLRLAFRREGDRVLTTLEATKDREGWPERLHTGVLYIAMLETANWTVFGLKARAALPVRTGHPVFSRWVPTGTRLSIEGRVASDAGAKLVVDVRASDARGEVASVEREFELVTRGELVRRLGYERLPAVLADLFPA